MDWVIVAATVAIAVSAITSLWLNWRLTQDNRALRQVATEPKVVAYLAPDPRSGFLVDLTFANVGQGPACDVEYWIDADPRDFARLEVMHVSVGASRKIASLLPQGEQIRRFMGVGNHLYSEDEEARLQPFTVKVWYSNLRGVLVGPEEFTLDIVEMEGMAQVTPSEERLAKSLEKIEVHLRNIVSGHRRLRVETITESERRKQDDERRAVREQATAGSEEAASESR